MATQTQLVQRTLELLGMAQAGQTASAEDIALVEAAIPGKLEELRRRAIVYIADPDDFEDEYLEWVAMLLSQTLARSAGETIEPTAIQLAEMRLREMNFQEPDYDNPPADDRMYF